MGVIGRYSQLGLTGKSAKALGKTDEARHYFELAKATKKAFHKRFYNEQTGSYGAAGGNIFALKMGVPESQYRKVVAALKKEIKTNKGHLDTGIFGTQFFFEVLSDNGMHDLAYEAMNKKDEPGYGRWLELGATTTWEQWSTQGSHNHPMFGGGLVWYYRKLAGMNADENEPGFKHIIFKPQPIGDISFTRYYNQTAFGKAGIYWQQSDSTFSMDVMVPVGSHATVYVPAKPYQQVAENGNSIANSKQVEMVGQKEGYAIFSVQSGEYAFEVK